MISTAKELFIIAVLATAAAPFLIWDEICSWFADEEFLDEDEH